MGKVPEHIHLYDEQDKDCGIIEWMYDTNTGNRVPVLIPQDDNIEREREAYESLENFKNWLHERFVKDVRK